MWILLRKQPPTEYAPPAFSIFWAMRNKDCHVRNFNYGITKTNSFAELLRVQSNNAMESLAYLALDFYGDSYYSKKDMKLALTDPEFLDYCYTCESVFTDSGFSGTHQEQNWFGACTINYRGREVTLFPSEFTYASLRTMQDLALNPEAGSRFIQDEAQAKFMNTNSSRLKALMDASKVDGANDYQAWVIATGGTFEDIDEMPSPLGWYKIHPAYATHFMRSSQWSQLLERNPDNPNPDPKWEEMINTFIDGDVLIKEDGEVLVI